MKKSMKNNMNNLKETVLKRIQSGEVSMRPKWHFVLKGILLLSGVGLLLLSLIYLLSFTLFVLRESGVLFVPGFGLRGMFALVFSSPWLLIVLALVFIIALEILVRRYSFAYKKPLLYSVVGIVFISLVGVTVMAQTTVHERIQQSADQGNLPFIGDVYRAYNQKEGRQVHVGIIEEVTENGYIVSGKRGEELIVNTDQSTRFVNVDEPEVGESIVILGEKKKNEITAQGIRDFPGKDKRAPGAMRLKGERLGAPQGEILRR